MTRSGLGAKRASRRPSREPEGIVTSTWLGRAGYSPRSGYLAEAMCPVRTDNQRQTKVRQIGRRVLPSESEKSTYLRREAASGLASSCMSNSRQQAAKQQRLRPLLKYPYLLRSDETAKCVELLSPFTFPYYCVQTAVSIYPRQRANSTCCCATITSPSKRVLGIKGH
ncbi:hypothetical protein QE152_g386 [Popillia japonica]|uniref:Uncharacterized protein n=1 Tax=Popillia japonica TaxID=7064 RepID=A0AAW1NJK9_POPJA